MRGEERIGRLGEFGGERAMAELAIVRARYAANFAIAMRRLGIPVAPVLEKVRLTNDIIDLHDKVTIGADAGFYFNLDSTSLVVISDHGISLGEEYTFALLTDYMLSDHPGKSIVTNVSSLFLLIFFFFCFTFKKTETGHHLC